MPKLGQTVEESTLLKWHKKSGDQVKKGDILFEIETDKAVLEIESFVEGTLLKIIVNDGETVPVTAPVAFVGKPGEPIPDVPAPVSSPRKDIKPTTIPAPDAATPIHQQSEPEPLTPEKLITKQIQPVKKTISPRARRLAKEHAISPEPVDGSGPKGRVTEKDIIKYLKAKKYNQLRITPAAKSLAIKEKIDILSVETEEKGQRISIEDIERQIAEKPKEMSKMRQVIAQRLTQSFTSTPHYYVTVAIDMTDLLAFREKLKKENKSYSVTDFIVKASANALKEFPALNSTTDGKLVRWHSKVHVGLAVEVKEGLVVPVIRNADAISLGELHKRAKALVVKARDGKLSPDEMTGGTFTVSNMGMLNIDNFTAIINPGESAILAIASTFSVPTVVNNEIKIRSIMKATVSSDHRFVDGAMASRFINRIKDQLEDIKLWINMI
ncbi:dihydrolipoamide acetyltransferase family protein [Verrucomicrobiota bacterium]